MYRGMAAQLTLTSDDGDDDTFYVKDAKATQGKCTTEGNVLTYNPGDFLGTAVVSYKAASKHAADQDKRLIVHVIEPPASMKVAKGEKQQLAVPSASVAAAASASVAAAAASLPPAAAAQLHGPSRQEVTMYRGMAAQLTLTSDDGDDDTFYVKDAKATQGKCTTEGNVLTYNPGDFLGTAVVSYKAASKHAADQDKALVVNVIEPPASMKMQSKVQKLALPASPSTVATFRASAEKRGELWALEDKSLKAPSTFDGVTVYQGTSARLEVVGEDPKATLAPTLKLGKTMMIGNQNGPHYKRFMKLAGLIYRELRVFLIWA